MDLPISFFISVPFDISYVKTLHPIINENTKAKLWYDWYYLRLLEGEK